MTIAHCWQLGGKVMGMKLWDRIFLGDRETELLDKALRVARKQNELVWRQLAARAGSLKSVPEARGYIRSRAVRILRSGIQQLIGRSEDLSPKTRDRILERAMELIIGQYVAQMLPVACVPAAVRRAA